jgi:hypothetical protein
MKSISRIFLSNNSIKQLYICRNNLAENDRNTMYLSEGLKLNTSTRLLDLDKTNLGVNENNMIHLSDCLKFISSI